MKKFSSVHSIHPYEYGIEDPEGMAYSPAANAFILWGTDQRAYRLTPREELAAPIPLAQPVENPLGAAFDAYSNTLFILGQHNTELSGIGMREGDLPAPSGNAARFDITSFNLQDAQGMSFDPATGRLFILDAGGRQILVVSPHPARGFDGASVTAGNGIRRISLESLSGSPLRGIAYNPNDNHLYVGSPDEHKVYVLAETGEELSTYDVRDLNIENPTVMLFAPSQDSTDDPNIMDLYILDSGQPSPSDSLDQGSNSQLGQVVELSLQAPASLPPGTNLLPGTLVRTFDTSNAAWDPSAPDPAGIDYWPARQRFLISDSEVDEMPIYFQGKNVFLSTTSGALTDTCSTMSFTGEPTGVAINPDNNHIFFSTDFNDRVFEVSLGPDGNYCTADDNVTTTNVNSLYNITDAEDVAYGNNTLFIGGGDSAEVYRIPLGPNGVFGGGDDGDMTHFDTASMGFGDVEAIGYNTDSDTLFIASPKPVERYLGEVTPSGTLLRAYDLSLMGSAGNIRSDVTYAPSSQNPAFKNIYIASRGVDNDNDRNENDGKVWEIRISTPVTPTPTPTITPISVTLKSAGVNDGWILESAENSGAGGTQNSTATIFNLGDDAADKQYRSILSFNTSNLPDNAVITRVTLKVRKNSIMGGGNPVSMFQGFKVDIRKGTFGAVTLEPGDFKATASNSYGPISSSLSGGWYSLDLTIGKAYINKMGHTQIRLRFNHDDNDNNLANILKLFSGNAAASDRPQLIIQYYVP